MSEDDQNSSREDDEEGASDVKSKLAKMSGSRLKREQAARRERAKAVALEKKAKEEKKEKERKQRKKEKAKKAKEKEGPQPQQRSDGEAEREGASASVQSDRDVPSTDADVDREPPPQKQKKKADRAGASALTTFAAGAVAGCIPAVVLVVMAAFGPERPTSIPADAVERNQDYIHCSKPVSSNRWPCKVYDPGGSVLGSGQFLPAATSTPKTSKGDWRALARQSALVPDGTFLLEAARTKTLYVRGVAVSSTRIKRSN